MIKSWKTTATGILAIVTALVAAAQALVAGHPVDYATLVPAVLAGIGLISARDNNVTSEQAGLKQTDANK